MRALYAITHYNVFQIRHMLKRAYEKVPRTFVMTFTSPVTFEELKELKPKIILVPTVDLLFRYAKVFDKCKSVVIVFDCAPKCDFLSDVTMLDVARSNRAFSYRFKDIHPAELKARINEGLKQESKKRILRKDLDMLPLLIEGMPSSLMGPIMDFLYSIPNTDRRTQLEYAIFTWFKRGKGLKTLGRMCMKAGGYKKPPKALLKLLKALDTKTTKNLVLAVRSMLEAKENKKAGETTPPASSVAKKFEVDDFDLRYVMNVLRKYSAHQVGIVTSQEVIQRRIEKRKKEKGLK